MRLRLQCVIIALGLTVSCGVFGQQSVSTPAASGQPAAQSAPVTQGNQPSPQQQEAKSTQEPTILYPAKPANEHGASRESGEASKRVGADESAHGLNESVIANFTIILAIATILLMFFTGALWWETRKLAAQAKEASQDTKKSIEIASSLNEREFRAYVRIDLKSISVKPGSKIFVSVNGVNYGRTPASRFTIRGGVVIQDSGWNYEDDDDTPAEARYNLTLHPGNDHYAQIESKEELTQDLYDKIIRNELTVYIRCISLYSDVAGQMRKTQISFEFSGKECANLQLPRMAHEGNYAT